MGGQHGRKFIARQVGVFPFAVGGERVEPDQLRIHDARMAHDQAAVGQVFKKTRKDRRELRAGLERIGPGERRIGGDAGLRRTCPKGTAEPVDQQPPGCSWSGTQPKALGSSSK